jgi:hypothetical protein
MNRENKKVLVIGAGGFIGSHLVERLVEFGRRTPSGLFIPALVTILIFGRVIAS